MKGEKTSSERSEVERSGDLKRQTKETEDDSGQELMGMTREKMREVSVKRCDIMNKRRKLFLEEGIQTRTGENHVEKTEKVRGGRRNNKIETQEKAGETKSLTLFLG